MRHPILACLLAAACLSLAACRKGELDGTYASSVQSITFHGDKADVSLGGNPIGKDWRFNVYEKKLTFFTPGGAVVYTLNDDGSLGDPSGDKLVKK